ncbi:LYR motif-containing protein 4 [Silurus meridionalis]|nr:LYR motif-containing protein 4 [Silurus meridionalis]
MAAPSRTQVLALYRMLLKESNKFPSYNYRQRRTLVTRGTNTDLFGLIDSEIEVTTNDVYEEANQVVPHACCRVDASDDATPVAATDLELQQKESQKTYTLRRVRDAFRENRNVEDPKVLEQLLNKAQDNLAIIQRQDNGIEVLKREKKYSAGMSPLFSTSFMDDLFVIRAVLFTGSADPANKNVYPISRVSEAREMKGQE